MDSAFYQQPYVEHIRKKYFSLFSVCITDIERKIVAPDLDLIPSLPSYHNDKVRSKGAVCIIDLKV